MLNFKKREAKPNSKISRRSALNYYRSNQPGTSSPFQRSVKTKKRRLFSRFIDWLVILILLAGLVYSLALKPSPIVVLNSADYRSADKYQQTAAKVLTSFKNRNKLTFDNQALEAELKRQFPEIDSVSINLPLFGQQPTIDLQIAEPALLLKGEEGTFGATARYIVDSKGTIVGPQADFPSIKDLTLVADDTGFAASSGQSVLSPSDISFISTLIVQAKKSKVPIASLTLPKKAQELDLRTTDRKYYVKFYLGGDGLTQIGQFLAARRSFDSTKKQPNQYLDVRVTGKVFYK